MYACASPRSWRQDGEDSIAKPHEPPKVAVAQTISLDNTKLENRLGALEDEFKTQQTKLEEATSKLVEVHQVVVEHLQKIVPLLNNLQQSNQDMSSSRDSSTKDLSSKEDTPKWVPEFALRLTTRLEELLGHSLATHHKDLSIHLREVIETPRATPREQKPNSEVEQALVGKPLLAQDEHPGSIDANQLEATLDKNCNYSKMAASEHAKKFGEEDERKKKEGDSRWGLTKRNFLFAQHTHHHFGNTMVAGEDEYLQKLVTGHAFQMVVLFVIFCQSAALGWEGEIRLTYEVERLGGTRSDTEPPRYFEILSYVFTIFFVIELIIRIVAWRANFFSTKDSEFFAWNCFDLCISLSSIVELIFGTRTGTVVRSVRLLRVARLLRMLRVFPKLRKMVYGLMHSMRAFFWMLIMLFLSLYVFTLAFGLSAAEYLKSRTLDEYQVAKHDESQPMWIVLNRFGTLPLTMRSLFASLTGGDQWDYMFQPMMEESWFFASIAIFFVVFFVFAVMNVVTGVFVHEAMKISEIDKDIMISDLTEEHRMLHHDMHQLVSSLDQDGDGFITKDELKRMLAEDDVQRWLAGCDIDLSLANMDHVLQVLDEYNTGQIRTHDFFSILSKITGQARSVDIFFLYHEVKVETQRLLRMIMEKEEKIMIREEQIKHAIEV